MNLFLLEPQNTIIQDHDQGQEKENKGARTEAKSVLIHEETELKMLQTQTAK